MSPAQEVLGKRLCDEAQLQEEADGALAPALGKAGGIMDGEAVELNIATTTTVFFAYAATAMRTARTTATRIRFFTLCLRSLRASLVGWARKTGCTTGRQRAADWFYSSPIL